MIQALKRFYNNFGDRGVMFIMFAAFVVLHSLMSLYMELPAINPDEFGTASVAAFYSGRDWSALMGPISYYYGYVQAVFYAPLFILFENPYALYKACIVMNGVLVSLIPVIAYHSAARLGVKKVWQRLTVSLCCGCYITYIAHSKFMWNETICSLLPWILLWVMLSATEINLRESARVGWSVAAGILCAVCYAAHSRLIALSAAFIMTVVIVRIFMRRRIFNMPIFLLSAAAGFVGEHFARNAIQEIVWAGNAGANTIATESGRLSGLLEEGGIEKFFSTLFGHLYTFATSTVGFGALAFVVFFMLIFVRITEWKKNRAGMIIDGVNVYEPMSMKHKYSSRITAVGIYAFLAVGGSMMVSVLFKFNSSQADSIKDLTMFGRYTDNAAPLAIFLVLIYLFRYGLSLKNVGWGAAIYAYICFGFFTLSWKTIEGAKTYRESPVLGLMPWRIGEDYTTAFTAESFIIMTSVAFSVLALFAVFTGCARKNFTSLISAVSCGLFIYTTIFAATVYIPDRAETNLKKTEAARLVSTLLYNEPSSPTIVAYDIGSRNAGLIQFLNLNTKVAYIRKQKNIPENCIIVADEEKQLSLDPESYDYIGTEGGLSVYACGEAARDYMKYKRSADAKGLADNTETEQAEISQ